jgi:hypothetical protein
LWLRGLAVHHGWPVTFGLAGGVMIAVGLVVFIRLLRLSAIARVSIP